MNRRAQVFAGWLYIMVGFRMLAWSQQEYRSMRYEQAEKMAVFQQSDGPTWKEFLDSLKPEQRAWIAKMEESWLFWRLQECYKNRDHQPKAEYIYSKEWEIFPLALRKDWDARFQQFFAKAGGCSIFKKQ